MSLSLKLMLILFYLGITVLFFNCIDTQEVGFFHDDGLYVTAAKSIAEGQGYLNLHLASTPAQVRYPFVYPFILSWVWMFSPVFPENLVLMSAITMILTIAGYLVFNLYLKYCKNVPLWIGMLITVACAFKWNTLETFTSLMSEGPYLLFSFMTLFYFEKKAKTFHWKTFLILLGLSVLTFYTRIIGITVMGAIALWILLNKQWRYFFLYSVSMGLLTLLPWLGWGHWNTPDEVNYINYPMVAAHSNYWTAYQFKAIHIPITESLMNTLGQFLSDIFKSMFPLFYTLSVSFKENESALFAFAILEVILTYGLFFYFTLLLIREWKTPIQTRNFSSLDVSLLYLLLYCVLIIFWGYDKDVTRFLTVVTPLLWYLFLKPMVARLETVPAVSKNALKGKLVPLTAILFFILLSSWEAPNFYQKTVKLSSEFQKFYVGRREFAGLWQEYRQAYNYIQQHVPPGAVIGTINTTTTYLYTGHPTYVVHTGTFLVRDKAHLPEDIQNFLLSMKHYKVQYVLQEPDHFFQKTILPKNPIVDYLVTQEPNHFQLVYESPWHRLKLYKITYSG